MAIKPMPFFEEAPEIKGSRQKQCLSLAAFSTSPLSGSGMEELSVCTFLLIFRVVKLLVSGLAMICFAAIVTQSARLSSLETTKAHTTYAKNVQRSSDSNGRFHVCATPCASS